MLARFQTSATAVLQNRREHIGDSEMVQYTGVPVTEDAPPSTSTHHQQHHHRAVLKNGTCNLYPSHVAEHKWRFVQDSVTTVVDMRWRYALCLCALSFFFSWTAFAVLWWLIAYAHGDFEKAKQVGLVFLKILRPKQRTRTLQFSDRAVVCRRDGRLCFMFRVGDLRRSHIIEAKMRVLLIQARTTREGEVVSPSRTELKVEDTSDAKSNFFCLLWPETVVHSIDKSSPLYELSADDLQMANFEIVVIMEGTIESTDQRVQARTSYLPAEILWGQRFESVVSYDKSQGRYIVDYSRFHCTQPVETPRASAREQCDGQKMSVTTGDAV